MPHLGGRARFRSAVANEATLGTGAGAGDRESDGRPTAHALIGRERELAELEAALERALSGRPVVCMLAGEPGVGKTALAEALADRAQARGALPLWGACWEGAGAPAYWPWVQVLRALVRRDPGGQALADQLGPEAAVLAPLLPELADSVGDQPEPPPVDPEQARFRLLDAISQFLCRASSRQPLLVGLDDLHWADHSSLLALEFFARTAHDAPVLVLGTYRETGAEGDEAVGALLADLVRDSERVSLRGLASEEIAALIERRAGVRPAEALVERLDGVTEGNPFFVDELVRLLAAEGRLDDPATARGQLPLPDGVRKTIRRRLEPLPPESLDALRVAAVLGRDFHLGTLTEAAGRERGEVLEVLDRARELGVVTEAAGEVGRYQFSHGLVRETLYEELSTTRRAQLHAAVGEALERRYGAESEQHLAELAHHFLEAARLDPARGVDYALRAGDRTSSLSSWPEAAELYERALAALELVEPDDALRWRALQALGQAQVRAGDVEDARSTLMRAANVARRLGDPLRLGRTAVACEIWSLSAGDVDEQLVALLEEAIASLEAAGAAEDPAAVDAGVLARLRGLLATALYWSPAVERRRRLADEAVALARARLAATGEERGGQETLAYVLNAALLATWDPDSAERDRAVADELLGLCGQTRNLELELQARIWRINSLLEVDDLPGADADLQRVARAAAELRQPRALVYLPLEQARRALMEGRYQDAERLMGEGAQAAERVPGSNAVLIVGAQAFVMRWGQGRLVELEPILRQTAANLPAMPAWRCALAVLLCEAGRPDEARAELDRLATDDFAGIPRDSVWLVSLALLAEACAYLEDADRARTVSRLLEPYAHRNVVSPSAAYVGPVTRYLGICAATAGEWETAFAHFAAARASAARQHARPTLALVALDEARARTARGAPEDAEQVAQLAAEGREIAEELGMEAIVARLDALGAPPAPAREERRPAVATAAVLRREGDVWTIEWEGRSIRLRDAKGLHYLRTLLASPGVELPAIDLVGGSGAPAVTAAQAADAGLEARAGTGDAGALLDAEAKAAYKERLDELREEIEEAESFHDPERAARAREELEFITRELAGAVGLGGRDRKAASDVERARVNATRAIRSVIKRISEHDRDLGSTLERSVRTGTFCVYEPDPRSPLEWDLKEG